MGKGLTLPQIKNLTKVDLEGKTSRYISLATNLYLRLWLSNEGELSKTFVFRSKLNGKTISVTIGNIEQINLSQAKEQAIKYKQMVLEGLNPQVKRHETIKEQEKKKVDIEKEKQASKIDFRHIARDYIEHCHLEGQSPATLSLYRYIFTESNLLHIYYLQLNKITEEQINTCLYNKKSTPTMANRMRAFIQLAINYAKNDRRYRNFTPDIIWKNVVKFEEKQDTYFLEEESLPNFFNGLKALKPIHQAMFVIYISTGLRKEELLTATKQSYNATNKVLTIKGKTDRLRAEKPREIPIPVQLQPIFEALLTYPGTYLLLSSAEHLTRPIMDIKKATKKLRENSDLPLLTTHSLRRAFNNIPQFSETFMTISGAETIRYALMGHMKKDVNQKHYTNVPTEKKRKYLETWLNHLIQHGLDLGTLEQVLREESDNKHQILSNNAKPRLRQKTKYRNPTDGTEYVYLRGKYPDWALLLNQEELDSLIISQN